MDQDILNKRLAGGRLSAEEGLSLFGMDLLALGHAANVVAARVRKHETVTYVVDRNISYTNACSVECDFCAFYKPLGHPQVYTLSHGEIFQKIQELADIGGTQVLIQGGLNPDLELDYYLGLLRAIRERFPGIHIHSFSPVEFDMFSRKFQIPLPELMRRFKEAGLNSMPGGGAEIFSERVRQMISPRKISGGRWLEVVREAHEAGLKTTATMVFGHVETWEERIEHLVKVRELQDLTGGFRAFIPWSFSPQATPRMSHMIKAGGEDYLRTVAVSRLMLDNVEHLQSGWLTEGPSLGQLALHFGCDDMGGTLLEDRVLEPTGAEASMRPEDLRDLIRQAGFQASQRNTNYEILDNSDET